MHPYRPKKSLKISCGSPFKAVIAVKEELTKAASMVPILKGS
jgi:hypothetical protein